MLFILLFLIFCADFSPISGMQSGIPTRNPKSLLTLAGQEVVKLPAINWNAMPQELQELVHAQFNPALAQAIKRRQAAPRTQLLNKPRGSALGQWSLDQQVRHLTAEELLINRLAGKADLLAKSEELMNMNPLEFACSNRDEDLFFLLANTKSKIK